MLIDWNRENIKKKDSQRRFNYKFAAVKFFTHGIRIFCDTR